MQKSVRVFAANYFEQDKVQKEISTGVKCYWSISSYIHDINTCRDVMSVMCDFIQYVTQYEIQINPFQSYRSTANPFYSF